MLLVKWQKKKTLKFKALAILQAVVKHRVTAQYEQVCSLLSEVRRMLHAMIRKLETSG